MIKILHKSVDLSEYFPTLKKEIAMIITKNKRFCLMMKLYKMILVRLSYNINRSILNSSDKMKNFVPNFHKICVTKNKSKR